MKKKLKVAFGPIFLELSLFLLMSSTASEVWALDCNNLIAPIPEFPRYDPQNLWQGGHFQGPICNAARGSCTNVPNDGYCYHTHLGTKICLGSFKEGSSGTAIPNLYSMLFSKWKI